MTEPRVIVVVCARDEQARIDACLRALAAQEGVAPGGHAVLLVDDGSRDATVDRARAVADATGLALAVVPGPQRGVGLARAAGLREAAARLRASGGASVLASTDADSVVAPDWLAATLAAIDAGADAVGGRITLEPGEAAALPEAVLVARAREATVRLADVRRHSPAAEHHQFSGASLALTLAAYDAVGGLPEVCALEDEALERVLRARGLRIAYPVAVRVVTSARTTSRVRGGLAQALRTQAWRSGRREQAATGDVDLAAVTVLRPGAGRRGRDVRTALAGASETVLVLGPGVEAAGAACLVAALQADPGLVLARAVEPDEDPLAELVVRPALNLHAPDLAVVGSPLTRTWAARRTLLERLALPAGDAVDLAVLLAAADHGGLDAVGEHPVTTPPPDPPADAPLAAYALLCLLAGADGGPVASTAFVDAHGTRRADLDALAPVAGP